MRRIVELHGGSVQATSDGLGRGSTFTVRLPLAKRAGAARTPEHTEVRDFEALRVLVVDDNQDAANCLCMLMKVMGHESRAVYDGPAGIAAAQDFAPEVAMLDIGMPIMNGYEVARALRHGNPDCTLVAVTGWGHEAAKRQATEAGFDHHLVKPVSEPALIQLLAAIAARRSARRAADPIPAP